MQAVTQAIYTALSGDSTLTTELGTFASNPAVFSGQQIPESADLPFVHIQPVNNMVPSDSKGDFGQTLRYHIACYTDKAYSQNQLNTITQRVRTLLHRSGLSISGYTNLIQSVVSIIEAPSGEDIAGNILVFEITIIPT